jgi:hypothetical protein
VRSADAASGQLLRLPFVWDDKRVLVIDKPYLLKGLAPAAVALVSVSR